jgi:hypothetical protein
MHVQFVQPTGLAQYLIPIVVIAIVLAFRVRRMRQVRPLRLNQLWIVPAIVAALAVVAFATQPPHGTGWFWCALALVAGVGLGWQRGATMRITVDPVAGTLHQTGSPAALIFILVVIALRSGARYEASAWGFNPVLVSGILLSMAVGLISAQRVEMYLRGRRMLAGVAVQASGSAIA